MTSVKEKSKKDKILGGVFSTLFFIIIIAIMCYFGEREGDYVKKNGVWTYLTVDKDNTVGNPKTFRYHFTFRGKIHKGASRTSIVDTLTRRGRRIFMMVVPNKPNKCLISSIAVPYWFTAEAPYEGWKTFPTDEELWAEMKAKGAEPGQPKDWSFKSNKRKRTGGRFVTWVLFILGSGVVIFLYLVDKEKIKL